MSKSSINKCLGSLLPAIALSILVTACVTDSLHDNWGVVTGYTTTFMVVNPSARLKGGENLKGHDPAPSPDIKLCFLTIKEINKPQIFTAQSGKDGRYSIELPEGSYMIKADSFDECKAFSKGNGKNVNDFVGSFFSNGIKYDEKGRIVLDGEPDVKVKAGQTVKHDHIMRMEVY